MINWTQMILATITLLILPFTISLRSKIVFKRLGEEIGLFRLFEMNALTNFANLIAPLRIGGLAIKPYFLKKTCNISIEKTFSSIIIEQIFEMVIQLLTLGIGIYVIGFSEYNATIKTAIISTLAILFLFLLFYNKKMVSLIDRIMYCVNYLPGKVRRFIKVKSPIKREKVIEALRTLQENDHKALHLSLLMLVSLLFIAHFSIFAYFLFNSLGIEITLVQSMILYFIPTFIGKISGVPGGYGPRDAAMIALLMNFNMSLQPAIYAIVFFRIYVSVVTSILGLLISGKYGINILKIRKTAMTTNNIPEK